MVVTRRKKSLCKILSVLSLYRWFLFDNLIAKNFLKCIIYRNTCSPINIIFYRVVFTKYYFRSEDIKASAGLLIVALTDIEISMKMNDFVFISVIIFRINYIVITTVEAPTT